MSDRRGWNRGNEVAETLVELLESARLAADPTPFVVAALALARTLVAGHRSPGDVRKAEGQ